MELSKESQAIIEAVATELNDLFKHVNRQNAQTLTLIAMDSPESVQKALDHYEEMNGSLDPKDIKHKIMRRLQANAKMLVATDFSGDEDQIRDLVSEEKIDPPAWTISAFEFDDYMNGFRNWDGSTAKSE